MQKINAWQTAAGALLQSQLKEEEKRACLIQMTGKTVLSRAAF